MRVGWGFDAHAFGGDRPVVLGGVFVGGEKMIAATSDGDVVAHAIADALLGAAALGDLGALYPSSDPAWENVASLDVLLTDVVSRVHHAGWLVEHVDVTVIAESLRVSPFREAIRLGVAGAVGLRIESVSVKATSTDGMGFMGRDEGIAAAAVVVIGPGH